MKVVEIIIDLNNPNRKPSFNHYTVTKGTENYLHVKSEQSFLEYGRRFYKKSLENVHLPKKLVFTYAFKTNIEDYLEIDKSEAMRKAMRELKLIINRELEYYRSIFEGVFDYYNANYVEDGET